MRLSARAIKVITLWGVGKCRALFYVLRGAAISISDNVPRRCGREIFARIRASSMRAYIIRAKVKCFYQKVGKNVKCALKPQSDERAREMFAHTAAKRCIANVAASASSRAY